MMATAIIGPTPGMVMSLLISASFFVRARISRSSRAMYSPRNSICLRICCKAKRAEAGMRPSCSSFAMAISAFKPVVPWAVATPVQPNGTEVH